MFKVGDEVDIEFIEFLIAHNPWTVICTKHNLIGSLSFHGHSGAYGEATGKWAGHCYYVPSAHWIPCVFSMENE